LAIALESMDTDGDIKEKYMGFSVILDMLSKELKRVEIYLHDEVGEGSSK